MTCRRGGDGRPLTMEEPRERFLQRERRGVETWSRLTPRQKRRQTKWQQHARQRENAARVALIMMMSGVDPPETLWRVLGLTDPPATGSPSGLQLETQEDPRLAALALSRAGLFANNLTKLALRASGRTPRAAHGVVFGAATVS
jgi:hypothetical protein